MQEKERSGEVEAKGGRKARTMQSRWKLERRKGKWKGERDATVLVDRLEAHDLVVQELLQPLARDVVFLDWNKRDGGTRSAD